jgi:hypothetical protein
MSLSFVSTGYEHINRGGMSRLFGVGKNSRYNPIRQSLMGSLSFDAKMSSIDVFPSSIATANVILFSNTIGGIFPFGDFKGDFKQVVAPKGGPQNFANLTDYAFNDRTRSMLLVNTGKGSEFRVSLRDTFLETWNQTLDSTMGGSASRKGDPFMSWEPFPEGISYLSSSQIYIVITQQLNINIDWWPDYDASITYHIYLYLDGSKKLKGYCQRWSAWVEGGIKSGEIMDRLWPKVESGAATINSKLSEKLAIIPAVKDFYYLPGRQLAPVAGVFSGSTLEDVTLVFEL